METPAGDVHVENFGAYPQANDAGVAIGGALHAYFHVAGGRSGRKQMQHAYWGKEVDEERVPELARALSLPFARSEDVVEGVTAMREKRPPRFQGR